METKTTQENSEACAGLAAATGSPASRLLEQLSDLTEREMRRLLEIEDTDTLCNLYVQSVHDRGPADVRWVIGTLIDHRLAKLENADLSESAREKSKP